MSFSEDVELMRECFEKQIMEIELIQSMYPNPGELLLYNQNQLGDINAYLDRKTDELPGRTDFVVKIKGGEHIFELCVNLALEYPVVEPDIFVRSNALSRTEQLRINKDISEYVDSIERGDTCLYSVISWLQDNCENYFACSEEPVPILEKEVIPKDEKFSRLWIYSHHIYSKSKKDEIMNLAEYLRITGFCLPGKPGIICIEGDASDCDEWWSKIRSLNWKKITLKYLESYSKDNDEAVRKFSGFSELNFCSKTTKANEHHMDMGELLKYLEKRNCAYAFNYYFGINMV